MDKAYKRYESNMMLPPVSPTAQWLETQRILADVTDAPADELMPGWGITRYDGVWDDEGSHRELTVDRYCKVINDTLMTNYVVDANLRDGTTSRYTVKPEQTVEVTRDLDSSRYGERDRRSDLYKILSSIVFDAIEDDMHMRFERIVAEEALLIYSFPNEWTYETFIPGTWEQARQLVNSNWPGLVLTGVNPMYYAPGFMRGIDQKQIEPKKEDK
jgi:hypothetical protein